MKNLNYYLYRYVAKHGINHKDFGKIYIPEYNLSAGMTSVPPKIYNKDGKELETFFVKDILSTHSPYPQISNYWIGDRFNFGLDTHLYSMHDVLKTMGNPTYKYALFSESETILPEDYKVFDKHKGLEKEFNYVFTFSEKLLNKLQNARFCPFCATPWYDDAIHGGVLSENQWNNKTKNISIISSKKTWCDLHKLRIQVALECKSNHLADTFGDFDGGSFLEHLSDIYTDYRYSIAIENDIKPYFFTEKITSCFAAMTIPIYLGASKISNYFNPDGIIFATEKDFEDLPKFLSQCNETDYLSRKEAIIDNYHRVMKYFSVSDFLYENYLSNRKSNKRMFA